MDKSTSPCRGCRDDFYNGHNDIGITQCWALKSAQLVKRWRLGWWTAPTTPGAFVQVETYSCHYETGRFAFSKDLPDHALNPVHLQQGA